MASADKPVTAGGNLKPPTKLQIVQWVKNSWQKLSNDLIAKSFKVCAISNNVDGTEDEQIKCLKECDDIHRYVKCSM